MKDYLIVIATTLILAWAVDGTRYGPVDSLGDRNKNRVCLFLMFVFLSLFIGLRTRYNDTEAYISLYNHSPEFPEFWEEFNSELGDNPGFRIIRAWLKTRGVSAQGFLLLFTIISMACSLYFMKYCSSNLPLSIFLFYSTNAYTLSAAAVKQSAAIAFGLIAIIYALKRKWLLYALFLFIAATIHPYVLVYALVPFLMFKPWTSMTYVILAGSMITGFALESLLGTIVDITAMIGDTYSEENLIGEGINFFRVLVANVPLVLSFVYRKRLFSNSSRMDHLMINLAMVNGAIMFVGSFGTAIYFSRLANFFTIAQCIALPWILRRLPREHRRFFTLAMVAGYCGFFIYANVLSQSFDANFSRITLWQYLQKYVLSE